MAKKVEDKELDVLAPGLRTSLSNLAKGKLNRVVMKTMFTMAMGSICMYTIGDLVVGVFSKEALKLMAGAGIPQSTFADVVLKFTVGGSAIGLVATSYEIAKWLAPAIRDKPQAKLIDGRIVKITEGPYG